MRWLQTHAFIFLYVVFTVTSQLVMRWRVDMESASLPSTSERLHFVASLLMTPWVWFAIACTFLAGVSWMLALTRFELTYAFPFTGISFVLILLAGASMFGEHVSVARVAGTLLVMLGLFVVVRS
jgi:multidrug transporter EmrE-like cation transporter